MPEQRKVLHDLSPVALEGRALDLILLLVGNHHRALDQREVTTTLWGQRPVSDNTLRQVVYKARRALGDDGEQQAIIRTLHGRSLQWVATVEALSADELNRLLDVQPARQRWRPRRPWLWVAVAALLLVVALGIWTRRAKAPLDGDVPRLAIEPISNDSGDKSLDWTVNGLPGLLASLLGKTGGFDVVDPLQSVRAWEYQPQQGRTREQQLRFSTGADTLVGGSLRKLTDHLYELKLRVEVGEGEHASILLTGEKPSMLAVDAVPRIRHLLALDKPPVLGKLPHDAFLAEAYARGMDMASHGQWDDARDYFRLCTRGAPNFLPALFALGLAQTHSDDIPGGEKTLRRLSAQAQRQGNVRMRLQALLQLGHLARNFDDEAPAAGYLQQAAADAQRHGDARAELDARAMLADVLHKMQRREESRQQLQMAETLAQAHPELAISRGLLYDMQSSIAGDEGDLQGALAIARAALELRESLGDERNVVVSMYNLAIPLRSLHRDAESLTVSAQCYQRATAGHYLGLEFGCAANLAASLLDLGLSKPAITVAGLLIPMAIQSKSAEYQVLALQLSSLGEMEQGDFHSALADLRKGDAITDVSKLEYATFLDQEMYEAMATFEAAPQDASALSQQFDAWAVGHMKDSGYAQRRAMLRALAAAAVHHSHDAVSRLRDAAAAIPLSTDSAFEIRMAPLLIAIAEHDAAAASIALKGYEPATTADASLLPLYVKWSTQHGDVVGATQARKRLAALRKRGERALKAADLDLAQLSVIKPMAHLVTSSQH
ncbi:MAG: winged helix-turn-helix domain-containing protein [Rhodanobacteraceae bacterium]